jgi:hypothetical protein
MHSPIPHLQAILSLSHPTPFFFPAACRYAIQGRTLLSCPSLPLQSARGWHLPAMCSHIPTLRPHVASSGPICRDELYHPVSPSSPHSPLAESREVVPSSDALSYLALPLLLPPPPPPSANGGPPSRDAPHIPHPSFFLSRRRKEGREREIAGEWIAGEWCTLLSCAISRAASGVPFKTHSPPPHRYAVPP